MGSDPAFLFYPNDYIGGTMGWSFEEKGAYIEVLMMQFNRGHMTEHMIRQTIGSLWDNIKTKFVKDGDGMYFNERLESEKIKRSDYTASRRNNVSGKNQYSEVGHKTLHMENRNRSVNKVIKKKFDFDSVWILYPKKIGKKEAFGYFNTTIKNEEDFSNIKKAMDNYIKYLKNNQMPAKYIKSGCNWFDAWEDWIEYVEPEGGKEEVKEHFKFDEVKESIEKQLCKIATDAMIEKCMRGIPKNSWWMVGSYLKRRFPDGGDSAYYKIESKLSRENDNYLTKRKEFCDG